VSDVVEAAPVFTARLLSAPSKLRQALEEQASKGEAEILVSVFDVPDTHVAMGNLARQIIDRGAFRSYLGSSPFPAPYFLDHGGFGIGPHRAELRIGKVTAGREDAEGLVITAAYNLAKQTAREAFSELEFSPEVVGFSFASDPDRERTQERDGDQYEHITEMWPVEFSHVGFGAQERARLLIARTAIASHSTDTSDAPWSGPRNEAAYPAEAAALRKAHAWKDPEGDPDAKATYKFNHHFAAGGAASTRACSAGIAILNGGRGGANIPDSDRVGVHRHLAKHLTDADMNAPPLRSAPWTPEELGEYINSEEFMTAFAAILLEDPARARDVKRAAEEALADVKPNPVGEFYSKIFSRYE
jgi:hypothetical protein